MFNNNYNNFYPYQPYNIRKGFFSSFRTKFNWSSILNNTQKTLNIINQAIPVIYQIKPIWNNTKTMFKIMGAIKEDDQKPTKQTKSNTTSQNINQDSYNSPQFFL